jgi:hypothetical protein
MLHTAAEGGTATKGDRGGLFTSQKYNSKQVVCEATAQSALGWYIFATQGLDLAIPSRQAWKQRRCEPDLCRRNASHLFARSANTAHRLEQNTGSSTAWFSHEDPQLAEAACETLRCAQGQSPQVSCSTRVLVPPSMQASAAALRREPNNITIYNSTSTSNTHYY